MCSLLFVLGKIFIGLTPLFANSNRTFFEFENASFPRGDGKENSIVNLFKLLAQVKRTQDRKLRR